MKKIFYLIVCIAFAIASCKKNSEQEYSNANANRNQSQLISTAVINAFIREEIYKSGEFNWAKASDEMLWSAVIHSGDHIVSVGYKPADEENVEKRLTEINISSKKWLTVKQQVLQIIFNEEKKQRHNLKIENLEVWKEKVLPVMDVTIENINTIKLLRQSKLIRYAEPMGYDPEKFENNDKVLIGGSGCGGYVGDNNLIEGSDYTVVAPSAKVSWNYSYHGIQNAWTRTTGTGIKVMVIDSGVSDDQDNLGSEFNQGYSLGRTIQKIVTLPRSNSVNDNCGHGTAMAGEIAAPRCVDGNSCGVAYNCNLVTCHASEDVYLDESREVKGVSDAYTYAANDSTIKITSESTGRITTASQIRDAILYAYGKGKLMFCAGGTSFSWSAWWWGVIFPASISEVNAITGIKDYEDRVVACDDCHKGPEIDFVIVMEKRRGGLHALSTATSGDVPTTVGGSSIATATSAGIAALVWSRFPTFTRDEVLNKLITTASEYPNQRYYFGWGKLNADLATQ